MVFTAHNTFELREFVTLSPDKWRVWSANGCLGIYWLCHSTWYILVGSHTGVYVCKHLLTHELLYTSFTQLANNQIPIWFTNHVFRIFCSIIIPIQSYFCRVLGFKNPDPDIHTTILWIVYRSCTLYLWCVHVFTFRRCMSSIPGEEEHRHTPSPSTSLQIPSVL